MKKRSLFFVLGIILIGTVLRSPFTALPTILGDIVIDVLQVERQAEEYNTGIIRELSYMTVHSFYHLMGEDHMEEEDKKVMRQKEENVLKELGELCK